MKIEVRLLVFCSNCGQELTGAKKFCTVCGYQLSMDEYRAVSQDEKDRAYTHHKKEEVKNTKPTYSKDEYEDDEDDNEVVEEELEDASEIKSAEISGRPSNGYTKTPPGTIVKEKIPKSTLCTICNTKTDEICFFCDWAICKRHSVNMQIVTDTGRFGNVIQSCPECANIKNGRQPTQEEAADVGFFFKIKPYHEWKVVR